MVRVGRFAGPGTRQMSAPSRNGLALRDFAEGAPYGLRQGSRVFAQLIATVVLVASIVAVVTAVSISVARAWANGAFGLTP